MALLNRFSKLNDRGETGIFTFIVTKSVTRDFHRDATTKDFCFGYHRWAISFQRPTEKVLGVHLLLRNPSPNTACVVDFTLTLLNREHFSQNEVYTKRQAKFTITNPMQGVSRWIQMSDLIDRHFSSETGEFLFELSLSNMTTIFECDIQLNPTTLTQYKTMLKNGILPNQLLHLQPQLARSGAGGTPSNTNASSSEGGGRSHGKQQASNNGNHNSNSSSATHHRNSNSSTGNQSDHNSATSASGSLINLETNYFTFGAFDWSLTIVPLVIPSQQQQQQQQSANVVSLAAAAALQNDSSTSSSSSNNNLLAPNKQQPNCPKKSVQLVGSGAGGSAAAGNLEPVCRVYLNRLSGFDCLCRVKYRVILGHHQPSGQHAAEFVDSKMLDQISDSGGRIRGHQFRNTNILKLISLRSSSQQQQNHSATSGSANSLAGIAAQAASANYHHQHHAASSSSGSAASNSKHHAHQHHSSSSSSHHHHQAAASLDLRVHIEMFCANTISEARVPLQRKPNEAQVSNCSDRNKQAWCVESDSENDNVRLKLFFMDLQSVPRNHIRYISWIAYIVRRDTKSGALKESIAVRNSPHSNYYLQDGIDMGTIMETDIAVKELNNSPKAYLDANQLTVHIEWVDSLLLFSHLYNNYDSLATIQRHQIRRELGALQQEFEHLERKYAQSKRALELALGGQGQQQRLAGDLYSPGSPRSESSVSLLSVGGGNGGALAHEQSPASRPRSASRVGSTQMNETGQAQPLFAQAAGNKKQQQQQSTQQSLPPGGQYQQHPRVAPMSHDERLKLSSSTPPGPASTGLLTAAPAFNLQHHHHQQQQQQQQQPSPQHQLREPGSALTQSIRRRLPQQPSKAPLQSGVGVLAAGANHHQIDRRDSQLAYQLAATRPSLELQQQQQQAIRAATGGLELGRASSPGQASSGLFAPSVAAIEANPINEQLRPTAATTVTAVAAGCLDSAATVVGAPGNLSMLMKENLEQQQQPFQHQSSSPIITGQRTVAIGGYHPHAHQQHQHHFAHDDKMSVAMAAVELLDEQLMLDHSDYPFGPLDSAGHVSSLQHQRDGAGKHRFQLEQQEAELLVMQPQRHHHHHHHHQQQQQQQSYQQQPNELEMELAALYQLGQHQQHRLSHELAGHNFVAYSPVVSGDDRSRRESAASSSSPPSSSLIYTAGANKAAAASLADLALNSNASVAAASLGSSPLGVVAGAARVPPPLQLTHNSGGGGARAVNSINNISQTNNNNSLLVDATVVARRASATSGNNFMDEQFEQRFESRYTSLR